MSIPFSILVWRIPWTEESIGFQRVKYDWATAQKAKYEARVMLPSWPHWWRFHFQKGYLFFVFAAIQIIYSTSFRGGLINGGWFCLAKGHPDSVKALMENIINFLYLFPFPMCDVSWKNLNLQDTWHRSAFRKPVFLVIVFGNFDSL